MVEEAEKKLYDIVLTGGDVAVFRQLLQEEPCLLERASFLSPNKTTPLHIAALYGNLGIVEEVLRRNRVLARQLDFQKSSPLHIAVAEGHVRISSLLFSAAPNMCWQRDCQGMNPVHIAAMKGNIEILNELIGLDCSPAMEKVDRGQTVLHLCVKHDNLKALEVLVESLPELVSVEDDDGNTILHLATRCLNYKIIQYLVENNIIETSKMNSKEKIAVEILGEIPPNETTYKIRCILKTWRWKGSPQSLITFRDIGMVISVLIATMAFQAIVNPPGGVWQDDSLAHKAGSAIMADTHPTIYRHFIRANTMAFASSVIVLLVLSNGISSLNYFVVAAIVYARWVSLASIAVSYGASIIMIAPNTQTQSITSVMTPVVGAFVSTLVLLWSCAWKRPRL